MSACVSPPHESVSHMVHPAASIATAASTALPPLANMSAPAVALSGLPVIAIQCLAWSGGFSVRSGGSCCAPAEVAAATNKTARSAA